MGMLILRLALAFGVATLVAFAPLVGLAVAAAPTENAASTEKRRASQRQLHLADTYVKVGAWDQAITSFAKAADSEDPAVASKGRTGLLDALKAKKAGALGLRVAGQRQLDLADTHLKAGAWDQAIASFSKAADSEDPIVASKGRTGLLNALNAKNAGALGFRAKLPAPVNRWWVLDYVIYGLVAIVLALILVPLMMAAHRILLRPLLKLFFKRDPSKSPWRVSVSGSAEEPARSVVFDEFVITMRSLRETGPTVRALTSVGPTEARFFTPLSLADLVGPDLVIRGIDITQIAATAQRFRDHFSYSFELRVDKVDNHAYAFASLRWGGQAEKSWQIPSLAEGTRFNFREIGRQLAFAIYGDDLVRK